MRTALVTERLDLHLCDVEDVEELHKIFSDPESNTIGDGPFASPEETASWVDRRQQRYEQTGLVWYAVRLRSTGELVGNAGSTPGRTGEITPELGYLISAHHRRRHYALEAAGAVLAEMLQEYSRVYATIRPANLPSISIVGQLGFRLERTERDHKGPLQYFVRDR
jgi:ribosomal-protein-alanine N-acetyltransferase